MYNTEYDGYKDGSGSFFKIQGQKTIYNFGDFSQFLWGSWMRLNNYTLFEARIGAHLNNFFTGSNRRGEGILDSDADQRAITNGFNYIDFYLRK